MKTKTQKNWNIFDLFLVLLIILALLSVYFSFVHPIQFSKLILREGVEKYAEIEILLPDDVSWLKSVIPVGEERQGPYGELEWKILSFEEKIIGDKKFVIAKTKVLIVEETAGHLHYQQYVLVKGDQIGLRNSRYYLEGRIFNFHILNEKFLI